MLFKERVLEGIRDGTFTVVFRCWRRPTVRTGGTLLTPIGQLTIAAVSRVSLEQISDIDARRAGYDSRGPLLAELRQVRDGTVYRIDLGPLRADPRVARRESTRSPTRSAGRFGTNWHGWTPGLPMARGPSRR
jgi:hypothetical protein